MSSTLETISYEYPADAADSRIWIDGCFDFAHHGHAGAMLQARRLGKELYVGVHSDEEILKNKGPTVMRLDERLIAVEGCRWCSKAIPDAPYTTDPKVMDEFHCKYVVHGDDITTNANGEDCYQVMKDLKRFIVVKRTPNISTTDLVGRMLLAQKSHHIKSITNDSWFLKKHPLFTEDLQIRFQEFATSEDGKSLGPLVFINTLEGDIHEYITPSQQTIAKFNNGIYYIDGGFDLFNPGHILALQKLKKLAHEAKFGVLVGINDDADINEFKGLNYPIMNILERSLCVLQSKYVDGILIGASYKPTKNMVSNLEKFHSFKVKKIFHGPITDKDAIYDDVLDLYQDLGPHLYDDITTDVIVKRVLDNRKQYEERQRKKGWKAELEQKLKLKELNG